MEVLHKLSNFQHSVQACNKEILIIFLRSSLEGVNFYYLLLCIYAKALSPLVLPRVPVGELT